MAIYNAKTGEVRFQGLILHVRGTFRMDTSMDEVMIWNRETKTYNIKYLCGSEWFAKVDASDEVKAEYYKAIEDLRVKLDIENAENKLKALSVGSTVKVVRGRKVPKDTVAKITHIYENANYTKLVLDNGLSTYSQNVQVEYKGQFIEPEFYCEKTFVFQAV